MNDFVLRNLHLCENRFTPGIVEISWSSLYLQVFRTIRGFVKLVKKCLCIAKRTGSLAVLSLWQVVII